MKYTYIETFNDLNTATKHWKQDLGIDIECENNLHKYRAEDLQRQAKVAEIMHKVVGTEMYN